VRVPPSILGAASPARARAMRGLWLAAGVWAAGLLAWEAFFARPAPPPVILTPHQAAEGFNVSVSPLGLPNLPGSSLGGRPAPAFALTTQDGRTISLSRLAGKVVVLTFVNTGQDAPSSVSVLTADLLRDTLKRLGRRGADVVMLAVTVNLAADSASAVRAWSEANGGVTVLTGSAAALRHLWTAYAAEVSGSGATLAYTPAVYVLNREGREETLTVVAPTGLAGQVSNLVKDIVPWIK
jgi:cytochrome oxidase Cu insertion factor (SCO1/SenC/PrrC family)